tara:strand:- start:4149 stop:4853 length:705 start_codon:yes stop_codon:yes gene_type:complete
MEFTNISEMTTVLMDALWADLNGYGILVYLAMFSYMAGLLMKNQICLRILLLIGSSSYIGYYYLYPAEPLWGGVFSSSMIILANIIGFFRLIHSRFSFNIPATQLAIYSAMKGLEPGEFRRLIRSGTAITASADMILTQRGETTEHLYFVVSGGAYGQKKNEYFRVPANTFIGEVSFLLGCTATASVFLPKGETCIRWLKVDLKNALNRHASLERSFEALLGRDMALKVANSPP